MALPRATGVRRPLTRRNVAVLIFYFYPLHSPMLTRAGVVKNHAFAGLDNVAVDFLSGLVNVMHRLAEHVANRVVVFANDDGLAAVPGDGA